LSVRKDLIKLIAFGWSRCGVLAAVVTLLKRDHGATKTYTADFTDCPACARATTCGIAGVRVAGWRR